MSFSTVFTYDTASELTFDSSLIVISSGSAKLISPYSTSSPSLTTPNYIQASALTSFSESVSSPAGTAITYCVGILAGEFQSSYVLAQAGVTSNSFPYYAAWTSGGWVLASSATPPNASFGVPAASISANLPTFFSSLGISGSALISPCAFLESSGSSTPVLTSNTFGYDFVPLSQSVINNCTVTAYLLDLTKTINYIASQPVTLTVSGKRAFFHGTNLIQPFSKSATFNSQGIASLTVIETETPGEQLEWSIAWYEGISLKTVKLFNAICPNVASTTLDQISQTLDFDFG